MNRFESYSKPRMSFLALLLTAFVAGCGSGGGKPILGIGGIAGLAPTVTAVAPPANATGVPINTKIITAAFSKAMDLTTLTTASFTLACPAGTPVTGAVTYLAAGSVATLTLPAAPNLPPSTVCTATVTTGAKDTTGIPLASNFVWTFTTGVTPDTTRPTVTLTFPAAGATGVATNTKITATFSEDMNPATLNGIAGTTNFTLTGPGATAVAGTVVYDVAARIATFTPTATLSINTLFTATITTGATDLAGNALASGPVPNPWTFTTGAAPVPPANVSVPAPNPAAGAVGVCPNATINATFPVPPGLRMDPSTVNTATFIVTGPGLTPVTAASVVLDGATGRIATFTPLAALAVGGYTATIKGGANGVKDLAIPGNTMVSDFTWTFTVASCVVPPSPSPIPLGTAAPFGNLGGTAGTTNQGTLTVINGDLGSTATATSAVTGFHDSAGDIYTETTLNKGAVNGKIFTCTVSITGPTSAAVNAASCTSATNARADAITAFNNLSPASLPGGTDPGAGQLGGLTLVPGVYKAAAGSFLITGSDLTLDAQGNANAVWVFQMASTLTVGAAGAPRSVILINGAQAKNVFWQVGSSATINGAGGGTMVGTILASSAISFSTAGNVAIVTLNGRAVGLNASVTMTNTVINVPAP